jgi:hypothetical protein
VRFAGPQPMSMYSCTGTHGATINFGDLTRYLTYDLYTLPLSPDSWLPFLAPSAPLASAPSPRSPSPAPCSAPSASCSAPAIAPAPAWAAAIATAATATRGPPAAAAAMANADATPAAIPIAILAVASRVPWTLRGCANATDAVVAAAKTAALPMTTTFPCPSLYLSRLRVPLRGFSWFRGICRFRA